MRILDESPQSKIWSDDELESMLEQLDKKQTLTNSHPILVVISCFDNIKILNVLQLYAFNLFYTNTLAVQLIAR